MRRPRLGLALITILILAAGGYLVFRRYILPRITPSTLPDGFYYQPFIVDLFEPTEITFAPDGRMFILERTGSILIAEPEATQVDRTHFLDLENINTAEGERGLVGFVLDPNFSQNGFYYVFYTANDPLRDRVSRFTANGNATVAGSEVVIWQDLDTADFWHHGGQLAFGADGKLYVGVGYHSDPTAGSANVSQRLDSYRGKILRMNSDGSAPSDNPFYDGEGPNLDTIWAIGLRNPFRFSFDSATNLMYVADVGGNSPDEIEELNIGQAGANYGWPICEGDCDLPDMTSPVFTYPHNRRDAAIIGGFVYHGDNFPADYQGNYFYADYAQNWIRRLGMDTDGKVTDDIPFLPTSGSADQPYGDIVDLKLGPDGALYYVDIALDNFGNHLGPGSVRRITYSPNDHPPVITAAQTNATSDKKAPAVFTFSSQVSDADNDTLTTTWEFGDNTTSNDPNPTHTYEQAGIYSARLVVSDGKLQTLSDPIQITLGSPPMVTITSPKDMLMFKANDLITLSATATDPDGTLSSDDFSWTVLLHHLDHVHPEEESIIGETATFTIPDSGHDFSETTWFEEILTVTDADNLATTASVSIYPEKVTLAFETDPPGLTLGFNELSLQAPFSRPQLIGFRNSVSAPATQTLNGVTYEFSSWSDGGDSDHTLTTPDSDQKYIAVYKAVQ